MSTEKKEKSFRDTLNLPKTEFPIRAKFAEFDPQLLKRWSDENLSEKSFTHNQGHKKFILHDGPPYANGDIHLGHAFNKILKDIFAKSERMSGKHVPITPGWDCHGLPIELKVTAEQPGLDRLNLKKACRSYAQKWVDKQRELFKDLGVLMDWDNPYLTMDYSYESKILIAFGQFYKDGFIKRQLKTVPWCSSCETVLAHAEIEYEDQKDPSIYVQFPLSEDIISSKFPEVKGEEVSLLIWTTTPWTIPLNRAVVLKPGADYQLVKMGEKLVILGGALVEKVAATSGFEFEIIKTFKAEELIGEKVGHPFVENLEVPIIGDGFTSLEDGTACVHSAPGCGPEDYEIGLKNNLEIYSPITSDGKYSDEIVPKELIGMPVSDGQIWVIKKLHELNRLFLKKSIHHSYPHCWRCHKGLIFRATSQWFCDLSKNNLQDRAIEKIDSLKMYPEAGRNRFKSTLEGRLEWCLSRQRTWGVPIPAVRCLLCEHVQTSSELVKMVADGVAKSGIEFWDEVLISDLPISKCEKCAATSFEKEFDILDVWFESGISHFAVLKDNKKLGYPADMYLEGKDQHRAWFQSSLLTSLVLENAPSMKSIVTHGFTVDAKGQKMSKSLGNVVLPGDIIKKIGLDGLRLWVASCDYDSDPVYSEILVKNVSEVFRKIRNSCRFLLSNLYDFDVEKDAIPAEDMQLIDQYAMAKLHSFNELMKSAYRNRKSTAFFHEVADFCVKDLSSFYLDIAKDRLYVEQSDGKKRRSAQTACYHSLDMLTKIIAPVLSCTAELISDYYQSDKSRSIHLQDFATFSDIPKRLSNFYGIDELEFYKKDFDPFWKKMIEFRSVILREMEQLRSQGKIKHSLEASISIFIVPDSEFSKLFKTAESRLNNQDLAEFLKEFLIVSEFKILEDKYDMTELLPGLFAKITPAAGAKCVRCWHISDQINSEQLCIRCSGILNK